MKLSPAESSRAPCPAPELRRFTMPSFLHLADGNLKNNFTGFMKN